MNLANVFLGCFAFGLLWSVAAVLLGGFHFGSHGSHGFHLHVHSTHLQHGPGGGQGALATHHGWSEHFLNLNTLAIFLAWIGGCGYLMMRHTTFGLFIVLSLSAAVGLAGGAALASAMRFLHGREFAVHPADYDMVGVLGRVSSPIREEGTGEIVFRRDGARQLACARSENGGGIARGQEVVVTSYRNGIAYVRTWDALTGGDDVTKPKTQDQGFGAGDVPPAQG